MKQVRVPRSNNAGRVRRMSRPAVRSAGLIQRKEDDCRRQHNPGEQYNAPDWVAPESLVARWLPWLAGQSEEPPMPADRRSTGDGYPYESICARAGTGKPPRLTTTDTINLHHKGPSFIVLFQTTEPTARPISVPPMPAVHPRESGYWSKVWLRIVASVPIHVRIWKSMAAVKPWEWAEHRRSVVSGVPTVMAYIPGPQATLELPGICELSIRDRWRGQSPS